MPVCPPEKRAGKKGGEPSLAKWIASLGMPWSIVAWIGVTLAVILLIWGGVSLNGLAFRAVRKRHGGIQLGFFERVNALLIIAGIVVFSVSLFGGYQSVWQTLLGGTAVFSAVTAFIAQDVIRDILAGLMLSVHKPFDIGDRIVLEDGTGGRVESVTMRHVVICGFDTVRHVVPNSRINSLKLSNYSAGGGIQSVAFDFPVGYESDLDLVKRVIAGAVEACPYTCPGLPKGEERVYAPVYFTGFEKSSLTMHVLVYYPKGIAAETVIDAINSGVREALTAAGVEIPYEYVNVVQTGGGKTPKQ